MTFLSSTWFLTVVLSDPFVRFGGLFKSPVLGRRVDDREKAVLSQYGGGRLILHHRACGDDFNIRFAVQVARHQPERLGGDPLAPEPQR